MTSLNFLELNEHAQYVLEYLRYCQGKLNRQDLSHLDDDDSQTLDYEFVFSEINKAIWICLHGDGTFSSSEHEQAIIKFQIFSYLMSKRALSVQMVIDLAIENQFYELFELLTETTNDPVFSVAELKNQHRNEQKLRLFIIGSILSVLKQQKYDSDYQNHHENLLNGLVGQLNQLECKTAKIDDCQIQSCSWSLFNRFMLFLCDKTQIPQSFKSTVAAVTVETEKYKLDETFIDDPIFRLALCVISKLTNDFNLSSFSFIIDSDKVKDLIGLHRCLYFLSAIEYRLNYFNSQQQSSSTVTDLKLKHLLEFTKDLIEKIYAIRLDLEFTIKHRLYEYRHLFKQEILKKSSNVVSSADLSLILASSDLLTSGDDLYALLKIIDNQSPFKSISSNYLSIFWTRFDEVNFSEKLKLIQLVYSKLELKQTTKANDNNDNDDEEQQIILIDCLYEKSFITESTLVINQLTPENCGDSLILNKIARLMCKSLHLCMEKLINNLLSNKNQINTLNKVNNIPEQILLRFKSLFLIKQQSTTNNVLIECLDRYLNSLLFSKSERNFQNFLEFLKLALQKNNKSSSSNKMDLELEQQQSLIMDADEFYVKVLEKHFKLEPTAAATSSLDNLLNTFEIFELLIKSSPLTALNVAQLAFLLQTLNVLNFMHISKSKETYLLSLKEKTVQLIVKSSKLLEMNKQLADRDLDWLCRFVLNLYWPYSSLCLNLTKKLLLPSCLRPFTVHRHRRLSLTTIHEIIFIDDVESKSSSTTSTFAMSCLLELAAINQELAIQLLLSFDFSSSENDGNNSNKKKCEILEELLQVFNQNRSLSEYVNIYGLILKSLERPRTPMYDFDDDDFGDIDMKKLFELFNNKDEENKCYMKFMCLLTDAIYLLLNRFRDLEIVLLSLTQFIKGLVNEQCVGNEAALERSLNNQLLSIYHLIKLTSFIDDDNDVVVVEGGDDGNLNESLVQDLIRFIIELSNISVKCLDKKMKLIQHKETTTTCKTTNNTTNNQNNSCLSSSVSPPPIKTISSISTATKYLIELCFRNLNKIEEKNLNYKYLLDKNFMILMKTTTTTTTIK